MILQIIICALWLAGTLTCLFEFAPSAYIEIRSSVESRKDFKTPVHFVISLVLNVAMPFVVSLLWPIFMILFLIWERNGD